MFRSALSTTVVLLLIHILCVLYTFIAYDEPSETKTKVLQDDQFY
jgi:hypothetical protein